jgi:hypothetical protein
MGRDIFFSGRENRLQEMDSSKAKLIFFKEIDFEYPMKMFPFQLNMGEFDWKVEWWNLDWARINSNFPFSFRQKRNK